MKVMNSEQIKKAEAIGHSLGIEYIDMMETAGRSAAMRLIEEKRGGGRTVVLCGKGKNGGDGYVCARYLADNPLFDVCVINLFGAPTEEQSACMFSLIDTFTTEIIDATNNIDIAINAISSSDIIVDAIFGIGFSGELQGIAAQIIHAANCANSFRFAIDIPSGISHSAREIPDLYFHADLTLTMLCKKPAMVLSPCEDIFSRVELADIGFSQDICTDYEFIITDEQIASALLPVRSKLSHKGSHGHILSICGSQNMPGAAVFAARAAVNSGCGLLTMAFPNTAYSPIAANVPNALMLPLCSNNKGRLSREALSELHEAISKVDVVMLGCGLGVDEDICAIIEDILLTVDLPLIIDADGINAISLNKNILKKAKSQNIILTPHPGEMSRLTGKSIGAIQADRIAIARSFAKEYSVTLLLKGHNTVIADKNGEIYINPTGNSGMARGGSGDVLTGIISAFAAQGLSCFEGAVLGAYVHGMAGDIATEKYSCYSAEPFKIIEALPSSFNHILKK